MSMVATRKPGVKLFESHHWLYLNLVSPIQALNVLAHVEQTCRRWSCFTDGSRLAQLIFNLCFSSLPYFVTLTALMNEAISGRAILSQRFLGGHVYCQATSGRLLMCLCYVSSALHANIFQQTVPQNGAARVCIHTAYK